MILGRSSLRLPLHNVNRVEGRMKMYGITMIFCGIFCSLVGLIKILQTMHPIQSDHFNVHDLELNLGYSVQQIQHPLKESVLFIKRFGNIHKSYYSRNVPSSNNANNNKEHVSILQKLNPLSSYRKNKRADRRSSSLQTTASTVKSDHSTKPNAIENRTSKLIESKDEGRSTKHLGDSIKLNSMKHDAGDFDHINSPKRHLETHNHANEVKSIQSNHFGETHSSKSGNESPIELQSPRNSFSDDSHHLIDESYPGIQALKKKTGKSAIKDKSNPKNSEKNGERKRVKI